MLKSFLERLFNSSQEWDDSDRRLGYRAKCDIEVEVAGPGIRYLGRVLDIGPQGARVRIRGPWNARFAKKDQIVHLKYLTPLFDAELDTVQCKIAWAKREVSDIFSIGCKFDDAVENLRRAWIKPVLLKNIQVGGQQKRKQLRVKTNLKSVLKIEDKMSEVSLRDLSTGGAKFESLLEYPEGSPLRLLIKSGNANADLEVPGVVKRCRKGGGVFQVGVAFTLEPSLKSKLVRLVKVLVDAEGKKR